MDWLGLNKVYYPTNEPTSLLDEKQRLTSSHSNYAMNG